LGIILVMVKIFVGGIPFNIEEIELVQLVAIYGEVCTIKIVRDKKTQKSKGYAFLEMANLEAAENAIEALDGSTFGAKQLNLNLVKAEPPKTAPPVVPTSNPIYKKVEAPGAAVKKKRQRKIV
jgi:RNA recognition motif-containing protein